MSLSRRTPSSSSELEEKPISRFEMVVMVLCFVFFVAEVVCFCLYDQKQKAMLERNITPDEQQKLLPVVKRLYIATVTMFVLFVLSAGAIGAMRTPTDDVMGQLWGAFKAMLLGAVVMVVIFVVYTYGVDALQSYSATQMRGNVFAPYWVNAMNEQRTHG